MTPSKAKSRRPSRVIQFLTQEELRRLLAANEDKRDRAIFPRRVPPRPPRVRNRPPLAGRPRPQPRPHSRPPREGLALRVYPMQPDTVNFLRSYLKSRSSEASYLFPYQRGRVNPARSKTK